MTTPRKPRLILIGNGMAGVRAVEELLQLAPEHYEIVVLGAEPHGGYNRILLSPLLAGEVEADELVTHPPGWYAERGIRLYLHEPAVEIDTANRQVRTARGRQLGYERLLLATGSRPFLPPVDGVALPGVTGFRDLDDARRLLDAARPGSEAVVIGGGVLGLETAAALARRNVAVTVVHRGRWLMERQLDEEAARLLQRRLEALGVGFWLGAEARHFVGRSRLEAVQLDGGETLSAQIAVIAAGIVPEVRLARRAGLACARGIVVDDALRTSAPEVFAVGECAEHGGTCYGLVAPLYEQARVVAAQLADAVSDARYTGSCTVLKLKVTGADLFSAGDIVQRDGDQVLVCRDARRGLYRRLLVRDDRLAGVVLVGDTADAGWYFDRLQSAHTLGAVRDQIAFGPAFADAA